MTFVNKSNKTWKGQGCQEPRRSHLALSVAYSAVYATTSPPVMLGGFANEGSIAIVSAVDPLLPPPAPWVNRLRRPQHPLYWMLMTHVSLIG